MPDGQSCLCHEVVELRSPALAPISTPEIARGSPPSNESRVGQPPDVPRCGDSPERRPVLQFSSNASTSGRTMALASCRS